MRRAILLGALTSWALGACAMPGADDLPSGVPAWCGSDPAALEPQAATPDPAALVGLYRRGETSALLDADGGYVLTRSTDEVERGRYRPRPGGIDLLPSRGSPKTMALVDHQLVDECGRRLAPVGWR